MNTVPQTFPSPPECPEGFKWCKGCKRCLPKVWFWKSALCKTCKPTAAREKALQKRYSISVAEYDAILAAQGGVCAICQNAPKGSKFAVDHDHKTGLVRGILCTWCNHKLLGGAREKVVLLERAIAYLKNPPARAVVGKRVGKNR